MKKILIPVGVLLLSNVVGAQTLTSTENYVYSKTYLDYNGTAATKSSETVQYFDGLGRPKQVVNVKASPLQKDVVTHIEYDQFGRQAKDYLPVPQSSTGGGAYYSGPLGVYPTTYGNEKIYSEKKFENSPLDRILEQKQVGNAWDTKPVKLGYDTNGFNEVYRYTITTNWVDGATKSVLSAPGIYAPNQLYKNSVKDEDGNETVEFKNGKGQVILVKKILSSTEHVDTYYIYNEYDQLAFVIPPKAVHQTPTEELLNTLCYQYRYDGKGRLVEKRLPGKGWEYMLYDKQDRLVGTQDTELKKKGQWLYTKYDQFGRVAFTGISEGGARSSEQTLVNNFPTNNVQRTNFPFFNREGMDVYYDPNGTYPNVVWVKLLSVNYYDSYPAYSFSPSFPSSIQGEPVLTETPTSDGRSTKGLPVMSFVKNIEDDNWTKSYTYYDQKGRAIATHSINHLGGYTRTESKLDFAGVPRQTITRHKRLNTDTERTITETFEYDHQNRLLVHKHQVDNQPVEILVQNTYNELSQLTNKKVGGTLSSPLQNVDYAYNIRGWMTKINDPKNLGGKLFGYEIKYNNVEGLEVPNTNYPNQKVKPRYNGNIAEIDWKTSTVTNDNLRRYGYVYDNLNRLTAGFYQKDSNPSAQEYNELFAYDLNGNILNLIRTQGILPGSTTALVIDNLVYNYTGNKLDKVSDAYMNPSGYPIGGNEITYDDNGNMTIHPDKGISSIRYNYLNLPGQVTQDAKITNYIYRSDGVKVRKYGTAGLATDYLDGFQYTEGSLKFVPTSEGYFNFENNKYIYNYTDHLGNVRLSYFHNGSGIEVLEENNYYPFGLKHEGYNPLVGNPSYKYKYNGKELQETGMYDYGARFYMPDIGRWGTIDPKSELLESSSPYVYALNSPILYLDKDGELPILINGRVESESLRASSNYWTSSIINTIKGSGIPNPGGEFHYVDGDRYAQQDFSGNWSIKKGSWIWGNDPINRIQAGRMAMTDKEFQNILSKLAKDPKTGKIIEKIQIYTHSRGAAFGQGYTERLVQMINENADLFADAANEVEFSYNMAPHQSGKLSAVDGVDTYTQDHTKDWLSGNKMKGAKGAFTSNEGIGGMVPEAHYVEGFQNDLKSFTSSFLKGGTSQQVVNNFIQEMKKKYNITVTVTQ